jgi:MFS family permease
MNADTTQTLPSSQQAPSPWAPFHYATFTWLWITTLIANIGTGIYNVASGWLMTSLNPDPLTVSMVQVANTLPMFLFALPAGALADVADKRKLLITAMVAMTAVSAVYAAIVELGLATSGNLLLFTFVIGVGSALSAPAWQSILPQLVPKQDLQPAVAANSVGVNVSRAVGPVLGGVVVATVGITAPFWLNAISNLGIIAALFWWHPRPEGAQHLPVERFGGAIRTGFRYARNNLDFRATLMRGVSFFLFASAYWALLPLVARDQIAGGPDLFGFLLGAIGAGGIGGAFALPWLKARLGPDRLVAAGTFGTVIAMGLFGLSRDTIVGLTAAALAGISWIAVLSTLNVSAQVALPEWVRGRGLSIFIMTFFGAVSLGSAIWGQVAALVGLPAAHFTAAIGALVVMPLTWRWKLQTGPEADLTPSMHWPAPIITQEVEQDRGPVLITIEYRIDPREREPFLAALEKLGQERRRDGAYAWAVFEDAAVEGRMVETFFVDSWLEHLRQHERVTNADRIVQDAVDRFHAEGTPKVAHLIASKSGLGAAKTKLR